MENKNHGVIAERVLEKEEAKELSRAKDKETKSEIRGKLADVADEIWDAAIGKFVEPLNGEKQDAKEKGKNQYSGDGGKNRKQDKKPSDGRVISKSQGGFDMKV